MRTSQGNWNNFDWLILPYVQTALLIFQAYRNESVLVLARNLCSLTLYSSYGPIVRPMNISRIY
jgi:hypothetical protein